MNHFKLLESILPGQIIAFLFSLFPNNSIGVLFGCQLKPIGSFWINQTALGSYLFLFLLLCVRGVVFFEKWNEQPTTK